MRVIKIRKSELVKMIREEYQRSRRLKRLQEQKCDDNNDDEDGDEDGDEEIRESIRRRRRIREMRRRRAAR